MAVSSALKLFARKLLALDETSLPEEQFNAIEEIFSRFKFDLDTKDSKKLIQILKKKHLVDSIAVALNNGSTLISSNGNNLKEVITGTALMNYIKSEIPKSETVLVKSKNDWFMLVPFKGKVFIIRAASNLSIVELKALVEELNSFLESQQSF
jgi:phosphotransferase system IIB component